VYVTMLDRVGRDAAVIDAVVFDTATVAVPPDV